MNEHPLITGFCAAAKPEQIDMAKRVAMDRLSLDRAKELANQYGYHWRSVYRWRSLGVNVAEPMDVANFLLQEKQPSTNAIRSALRILQSIETPTP